MGTQKSYSPFLFLLCCSFFILLGISKLASASVAPKVSDFTQRVALQHDLSWYHDASGDRTIEQVVQVKEQFRGADGRISFPRTHGAYWFYFKIDVSAASNSGYSYLLELAFSQLDRVDLFCRCGNLSWQHQVAGDTLAGPGANIDYRFPLFELPLSAVVDNEILIRVQSNTAIVVPVYLWERGAFEQHTQLQQLLSGLYYGILLALVLYNLFLFPTVRDTAYLWFAFYLGMFALFHFAFEGYARLYLWPDSPLFADRAVTLFIWLTMAAGLRFTQLIALSVQYAPRLHRLFSLLFYLALVAALISAVFGPSMLFFLLGPFGALVAVAIPLPLLIAWRAGYRAVRFALIAFIPILPGAILIAARSANLIEASYLTENLFSLGTALGSLLLSFALADRINLLREDKLKVQQQLLLATTKADQARRQFSRRLIETQDEQRRLIAADLHDGVNQNLSLLANTMHALEKHADAETLHTAQQLVHESLDEIRAISHQLHPHILDQIGLGSALEAIVERINQQGRMHCELNIDSCIDQLPAATRLHLYRIIQEALNNALKHSQADQVWIDMICSAGKLKLSIRDNGIGLMPGKHSSGLGLESIRERVEVLQGVVQFAENSPSGASIQVEIAL